MSHTPPHVASVDGLNGAKRAKYSPNLHGSETVDLEARNMEEELRIIEEKWKPKMAELDDALANLVKLEELKQEVISWAKGMLLDEKRRALGINVSAERRWPPHMMFLGTFGTGKTMVARILGGLLHNIGILPTDKVTEVQLIGLDSYDIWSNTTSKIREAKKEGGILFVDNAHRLTSIKSGDDEEDYGLRALDEIISVMHKREVVVIFAGRRYHMENLLSSNDGFLRRAAKQFIFGDLSSAELAQIVHIKMANQPKDSGLYGYQLHPSCTEEAITSLIENGTTEGQRNRENGHLVDNLLENALNSLNGRLEFHTSEEDELVTLTLEDLEGGIRSLNKD